MSFFTKRWFWITALFVVINVTGLFFIVFAIEGHKGAVFYKRIQRSLQQIVWPFLKAGEKVKAVVDDMSLSVDEVGPWTEDGQAGLYIELNRAVDLEKIKGYIEIKPETKFFLRTYYNGVRLVGDFLPGKTYALSILKGMPSEEGGALLAPYEKAVTIPDYSPEVSFKSPGLYLALKGERSILIETVNIDKVRLGIHKIYDNNLVYYLNQGGRPADIGVDVVNKELTLSGERNQPVETTIGLKTLIGEDRGLFYLRLNSADEDDHYYDNATKLVLATDIGILAKAVPNGLFIGLNSLNNTAPIANAVVKVFSRTNQLLCQGQTDDTGTVYFKNMDFSGDKTPFVITATTDSDLSFLELEKNVLSEADFDVLGRPYLSSGYEAFVYSDRGVYRPGERVLIRAIVRGSGVVLPDQFPVNILLKRPDGKEFKKLSGILSDLGTVDFEVSITDYAMTGEYQAIVTVPGNEKSIGEVVFNVEEFMPDSLKVITNIPAERYKIAESIPLMVKVQQSFGAAAVGRDIEVSYRLNSVKFEPKAYAGFSFSDDTIKYTNKTVGIDGKKSDAEGQGYFEIQLPEELKVPSAVEAVVKVVAHETGGHAVTNYSSVKVDAYPFYIGIQKDQDGFGRINQPVEFNVVTLLSDETGQKVDQLKVTVSKIIWSNILKKDTDGSYKYVTENREEVVQEDILTMNAVRGLYAVTPKEWGDYIIRVTGIASGAHTASLKFFVSGSWDSQDWGMERPDRINLKLDKEKYAAGETAKLLIQSPFKGKALVICSTDEVIYSNSLDLNGLSQEMTIPVTEEFEPNAYCSVSVIRPLVYEDRWSAHRAYGIIPLAMDFMNRQLSVSVYAPEKIEPGMPLRLDIQTSDELSELSVAVIDDAILRLTGFKTPDPYEFFYAKRANGSSISDIYSLLVPEVKGTDLDTQSSPAGDRATRKHTNPVNAKRVKPLALWESKIRTDANGRAMVRFTIPDFTGTLRYMVVASGKTAFGKSDGLIKVVQPIVITPTAPRFLAMNDQFTVPVSIYNMTGKDGTIFVSLQVSVGMEVQGEVAIPVMVKNNTDEVVQFELKAPQTPQQALIKVTAMMGDVSVSRLVEIPVRPPVPWVSLSGVGDVRDGQKAVLRLPGEWVPGTGDAVLNIQAFPSLKLLAGMQFLLKYPYGCIEQTTSTVYPLLYLKDLVAQANADKLNSEGVNNIIIAGIERIISLQMFSGGFGWWPGSQEEYPWGSIYAMDFLLEAERAGYSVPQMVQFGGLNYLEKLLSGNETDYSLQTKAYAVYVLAKGGRIKASWIRRLQERLAEMPDSAKFYIAGALALMGERSTAESILAKGMGDKPIDLETGGSLNSYVREQSLALSMYLDIMPNSPYVADIVKRLEGQMQGGRWATTQENGTALIALGKYARFLSRNEVDLKGSVFVEGKKKYDFSSQDGLKVSDRALAGKEVTIEVTGKGAMYYSWLVDGVPLSDKIEEKDSGLVVRRVFLTKDGQPADLSRVEQGEVLVADITLDSKGGANNLVLEDLLPAGFEIENPRLATSERLSWVSENSLAVAHMDMRDDRLVLFTDVNGIEHYRYVVRAVTKGDFVLPAIRAELMYNPNVYSVSGQGRVKVVEKDAH